jgi:predicted amidohydrolase
MRTRTPNTCTMARTWHDTKVRPLDCLALEMFMNVSVLELAKRLGLWMSLGGFHERSETEGKVFNSHLILNEHGEIVSVYRKIHMFKVTIANGPNLDENKSTQAGDVRTPCHSVLALISLFSN